MKYSEILSENKWYDILDGSIETGWINIKSNKKLIGKDHVVIVANNLSTLPFLNDKIKEFCESLLYSQSQNFIQDSQWQLATYEIFVEMYKNGWARYRIDTNLAYITTDKQNILKLNKIILNMTKQFNLEDISVGIMEDDFESYIEYGEYLKQMKAPFTIRTIDNFLNELILSNL